MADKRNRGRLTVCTGWSPSGWIEYGRKFAESFAKFWPSSVDLVVYGEEPVELPRGEFRRLNTIPGAAEFRAKYADDAKANGRVPGGYNFRWDAWKFSPQGFIPQHAAQHCQTEYLCWLDGDVETFTRIRDGFIQELLPDKACVAYLGRNQHSEIGFQLYRLPDAMPLLDEFARMYRSGDLFRLREWHSAYVWDHARKVSGVRAHSLSSGKGHVWFRTPLGSVMDHKKGKRKATGSEERRKRA